MDAVARRRTGDLAAIATFSVVLLLGVFSVALAMAVTDQRDSRSDEFATPEVSDRQGGQALPPATTTGSCVAEFGATYQDRNLKNYDGEELDTLTGWQPLPGGAELHIFYEADGLSETERRVLERAAAQWNPSPCVETHVVDKCAPEQKCILVRFVPEPDYIDAFGEGSAAVFVPVPYLKRANQYLEGGEIVVRSKYRDREWELRSIYMHEVGHSLGLDHRSEESASVMSSGAYWTVSVDDIDLQNLAVLYGYRAAE